MKISLKQYLVPILLCLICSNSQAEPGSDPVSDSVLFGSVAMDIPAVMHRRLKPLTKYLSAAIKKPVSLKLSPDMRSAISEVAKGGVDIAYLTPVAYLKANAKGDSKILVKTVTAISNGALSP